MTLKTFISYRRDDTSPFVDQLQAELRTQQPGVEVFRDIDVIAPGEDYTRVLQSKIDEADVFLAVIGPSWAGARADGRRIDDPNDVVRREISWRLRPRDSTQIILGGQGGARIEAGPSQAPPPLLPVLVGGATMPAASTLPEEVRDLAHLNAISIPGSVQRGFDSTPLLAELAHVASEREREDREITAELDALIADTPPEPDVGDPAPVDAPQVDVTLSHFSHLGSWTCTIGTEAPGTQGEFAVEFEVRSDNSMSGNIVTQSRGLLGKRTRREPIQGRADLLFLRPAGEEALHPVVRLEGVRAGAQPFFLEIPIQRQLGQVFVGSASGQSFALKQTGGHGL